MRSFSDRHGTSSLFKIANSNLGLRLASENQESVEVIEPTLIAENDYLRSRLIRHLVQTNEPVEENPSTDVIPKTVIQFWHDANDIPADVQECLDSWRPLETQGFQRLLFDDIEARRFIDRHYGRGFADAYDQCLHPAVRCDYFRLCYMVKFGGFYVDADEFFQGSDWEPSFWDGRLKIQPMCYDTSTSNMVPDTVFTKNGSDSEHWIFYVNNNPLVSPPNHPVTRLALGRSTRILLGPKEKPHDVQSTTGPGNLTASLVEHAISLEIEGREPDFSFLYAWDAVSVSQWPLSYRNDERNWRLWDPV